LEYNGEEMNKGELTYAIRMAQNNFDEWNDATECFSKDSSYYYEALATIEDAVKIGAKVATYGMEADLENLDKSDE
jgi:hypothetical protein